MAANIPAFDAPGEQAKKRWELTYLPKYTY
jgi:hypothetical protein